MDCQKILQLQICVQSMAQVTDCISHVIKGMDARPDVVGLACEALHRMFEKNHTELVAQVTKLRNNFHVAEEVLWHIV